MKRRSFLSGIRAFISRRFRGNAAMDDSTVEPHALKGLVRMILSTRDDEIGCDRCFELLDRFVDLTLAGKNAAEALPLVRDHLDRCRDCREEFEALLDALRLQIEESP